MLSEVQHARGPGSHVRLVVQLPGVDGATACLRTDSRTGALRLSLKPGQEASAAVLEVEGRSSPLPIAEAAVLLITAAWRAEVMAHVAELARQRGWRPAFALTSQMLLSIPGRGAVTLACDEASLPLPAHARITPSSTTPATQHSGARGSSSTWPELLDAAFRLGG